MSLKIYNKDVQVLSKKMQTDLFTIDINKVVVSDKVPCNNGKDCRYIVDYVIIIVIMLMGH